MLALMPRRRYRLFVVCAVVMVFLLYRAFQNSWDQPMQYIESLRFAPRPHAAQPLDAKLAETLSKPPMSPHLPMEPEDWKEPEEENGQKAEEPLDEHEAPRQDKVEDVTNKVGERPGETVNDDLRKNKIEIPILKDQPTEDETLTPTSKTGTKLETGETIAHGEHGASAVGSSPNKPADTHQDQLLQGAIPHRESQNINKPPISGVPKQHWTKPVEQFPLPQESIIPLPSGSLKKIPKIQYDFPTEDANAKAKRIQRQNRVKTELERAWAGYRKYAWMHDELSPMSNHYRDPFCGWAATLVDSLDTLWIAGMKKEFNEAAKAVGNIDFTYTPRNDIPVFETTIRYLGGMLAAYDVSGGPRGHYPILLDKSIELAEILMGIFDTPNRMPVLYYHWFPEYASQRHRAGIVSIAELGTLSMEFTRLAQLTGKDKYYDAVDRITNALVTMQEAGTSIPGLFPERIDASGCNKTAQTSRNAMSKGAKAQMESAELLQSPNGYRPGTSGQPGKGAAKKLNAAADEVELARGQKDRLDDRITRRQVQDTLGENPKSSDAGSPAKAQVPKMTIPDRKPPLAADGQTSEWDCEPQGLVPGSYGHDLYHMGGAQDSVYEYFPKQWLLLGGLEPKYQKLYEDTVDAIEEWLLFRPMVQDKGWDILFPAKVGTSGSPEVDLIPTFEITHLTCFIGGMYGLGGKIFGREQDIETAKKLTDGCVWAYQSTPSGIMPEVANMVPCPTLEECPFNETLWWEYLDTSKLWRAREMEKWEAAQAENEAEEIKQQELREVEVADEQATQNTHVLGIKAESRPNVDLDPPTAVDVEEVDAEPAANIVKRAVPADIDGDATKLVQKEDDGSITQDAVKKEGILDMDGEEPMPKLKSQETNSDKHSTTSKPNPNRITYQKSTSGMKKPMSHEEFVQQKIKNQNIPPGYTNILSSDYILRPEAIESVWYMYRITGDPSWMDKGWAMFESIVAATRTEFANSAIESVLSTSPHVKDEMESFWIAETLKYFYLLFSEPDVISLDDWVLNTEAHPFRRPT